MTKLLATGLLLALILTARTQAPLPADQFTVLTREHADGPSVLYNPLESPPLSVIVWQRETGTDLLTNQVILVVKDQARVTLPPGTPFGDGGQPLWILPQGQHPDLLYLGINVGRVPHGIFEGPIRIQLVRFDGPGYFMAWQATGPGQFNIRMNTRDGLDESDSYEPLVGGHEHFNLGFSTPGIYCVTYQASGRRIGESTNIFSAESTFVFQVHPLPPATDFGTWQKHFWPPGFNPPTTLAHGNPDGDVFENLREYAHGLSPIVANPIEDAPAFEFLPQSDQRFASITYNRYTSALDLSWQFEQSQGLPGGWSAVDNLTSDTSATTNSLVERVVLQHSDPLPTDAEVYYRLNVQLDD